MKGRWPTSEGATGDGRAVSAHPRVRVLSALWLAGALAGAACGTADPEGSSGGDAFRNEAQEMKLGELVTGELDRDGGDTSDWKFVRLEEPGKFKVALSTDKNGAAVLVGVYDKYGVQVGVGAKKKGSADAIEVPVNAKSGGKFFVKVEHRDGDKTTYSLKAALGQGGGGDVVPDI